MDAHRLIAAVRAAQAQRWQAAGSRSEALAGIICVLKSGIPWGILPKELSFASGVTCWRRLRDWQKAGVWHRLYRVLLDELGKAGLIDWSRASLDSATVPAKRGVQEPAPIP